MSHTIEDMIVEALDDLLRIPPKSDHVEHMSRVAREVVTAVQERVEKHLADSIWHFHEDFEEEHGLNVEDGYVNDYIVGFGKGIAAVARKLGRGEL